MDNPTGATFNLLSSHPELINKLDSFIKNAVDQGNTELCGMIITGPSGSGKTYLMEQYLSGLRSTCVLLNLNHNQQQSNIPYAGLKLGIAEFLRKTYKELDAEAFEAFSFRLKNKLGVHFPLLFDYIPELTLLAGKDPVPSPSPTPKIENQLYSLFKILFGFLSDYHNKPVLLFADNLQWMDGSSMNLIHYLLLHLPPKSFLWVGTCRDSSKDLVRVNQLIQSLNDENRNIYIVPLKGLELIQTKDFLQEVLGGPVADSLSLDFHEICEGNPSYMQVMAESLKAAEIISLENGRWTGPSKQIKQLYPGQSPRVVLWHRLEKISPASMELLSWLSCMGSYRKEPILSLFKGNEQLLRDCLKEVMDAGLIAWQEDNFRFSETYIGEVIYEGLSPEQREKIHFGIGRDLLKKGFRQLNRTEKVIVAQHLNQAPKLVKSHGESLLCITLNLEVGKLQKTDQAFEQARHFLKISEDLCKEFSWEVVKDLFWETAMERALVEYHLGEYDLAEIHLDQLLERPLTKAKRAETFILKITINNHLGRYRKVVTILHEALMELGLRIPAEEASLLDEINHLKKSISSGTGHEAISKFKAPYRHLLLKLLYVGGMALHHTSDRLMTWAALMIIAYSEGLKDTGVKAIGYVSYGRMNIISGNVDEGYELGLKGIQVNKKLGDYHYRCRVFGVFAFYIQPWKKDFKASTSMLREGMEAGRKTGDLIGLYILKTHLFNLHFISGQPIKSLLDFSFEEAYPGMELTYYITHYQKSLIRYLCGESPYFSIPRQQPRWLAAKLTIQEERFYRNYVWARYYFLFGHYEQAIRCAREAHANRKLQEGSPLLPANLILLFLSITQNWHNLSPQEQTDVHEELEGILEQSEHWFQHAPSNYASTFYLMKAEWARINTLSKNLILDFYQQAINHALENQYDLGLSHELIGKYLLTLAEVEMGKHHFQKAVQSYLAWEGLAKAKQLSQQFRFVLHSAQNLVEPDIETVLRELSGDLSPKSIIKKLMVLLIRISGSTKTAIEWIENNGEVMEQARLSIIPLTKPFESSIPSGLMRMCHRIQSPFILHQLDEEKGYAEIKSLREQGVKSMMVLPLSINGYLSMVVYLENSFATHHYHEAILKWVRLVANQGGMIIENARTHERTLQLNEEIRKEVDEKQKLASIIEKQKNNHLKDLIQTQEDERKRIAGDLHDSLGSLLSTIKMQLNSLKSSNADNQFETKHQDTLRKMDEAIEEVRRISHNMSPVSLRRFGLPSALQTLIEQINFGGQMDASLQILGLEERLSEQTELTIYRICQELVQNVIKHAKASTLHLQLINHLDSINITVEDNGVGLDKGKTGSGFGLQGIEAKVQMLNGNFSLESQPGKGCLAVVDIPINLS
ncbi:hypothetical protein GCM10028791_09800 [Echinicola sediminis]